MKVFEKIINDIIDNAYLEVFLVVQHIIRQIVILFQSIFIGV